MIEPVWVRLFPFVPVGAFVVVLGAHAFGWDISRSALRVSALLQGAIGVALWAWLESTPEGVQIALGNGPGAIAFALGPQERRMLVAYLVPLGAATIQVHHWPDFAARCAALLYMAGCSGLWVTHDLFNFYVWYELMTMAAYVLIAARGQHYASVKYMLFGVVSSSLLLGGIVAHYATGAPLTMAVSPEWIQAPDSWQRWKLLMLGSAFMVHSAFVPAWTWVPTCHAATVPSMSAFLASYTLMGGLYGLHRWVLPAARAAGHWEVLQWIETLAAITSVVPAVGMVFEREFKRCVAASSVATAGVAGWLLVRGHSDAALGVVAIHAVGKTLLFHSFDALEFRERTVVGQVAAFWTVAVGIVLGTGLGPTPLGHWKRLLIAEIPTARLALSVGTLCMWIGFLKFRWCVGGPQGPKWLPWAAALSLGVVATVGITAERGWGIVRGLHEGAWVATAAWLGWWIRRTEFAWAPVWRRRPYPNLNAELFGAFLVFFVGLVWVLGGLA